MARYFTSPTSDYDGPEPLLPDLSVSDHHPVDTGLKNHRGQTIWRGMDPIGFHSPKPTR